MDNSGQIGKQILYICTSAECQLSNIYKKTGRFYNLIWFFLPLPVENNSSP